MHRHLRIQVRLEARVRRASSERKKRVTHEFLSRSAAQLVRLLQEGRMLGQVFELGRVHGMFRLVVVAVGKGKGNAKPTWFQWPLDWFRLPQPWLDAQSRSGPTSSSVRPTIRIFSPWSEKRTRPD